MNKTKTYRQLLRSVIGMCIILSATYMGCKEKYALPPSLANKNYLVVEGFIDNGNDITKIQLSRTTTLDTAYINPEMNAQVSIAGDNGESYFLTETAPGIYTGGPYTLSPATKYKLLVQTNEGKQYNSDFVAVKNTPPIDSVSWVREPNGVRIYANTHDPENNSRYYAWQFFETWEFYSYAYISYLYQASDTTMYNNPNASSKFRCWQYNNSTNILIGSSAKLSSDVIYMSPLTFIPDDSWKISSKYSILLKQRVLSKGAYEYLEKMRKSSEQLGTIFDPQPSTSSGNMYCITDPTELVIGYIYTSSVAEKRIFIDRSEVGAWKYRMYCEQDTIPNIKDSLAFFFGSNQMEAIGAIPSMGGPGVAAYTASSRMCMDCTLRGSNIKPDYWP